jgi:ADP-ribosylglycohydrolase
MRDSRLYKKVYGSLLGGAIGDAFGIRTEFMHHRDIERQYGRVTHFDPLPPRLPSKEPPLERFNAFGKPWKGGTEFHPMGRWSRELGVYTDDTRFKLLLCHSILQKEGPVTGADFARQWLNYRMMAEGAEEHEPTLSWEGPQRAYARIMATPERLGSMNERHRPCFPGYDGPIGLLHAGDPERAAEDGYIMAAAVATALSPAATMDHVIENVFKFSACLDDRGSRFRGEFEGRLEKLLDIAKRSREVFDLYEPIYREFLVTYPPFRMNGILEMVPIALTICFAARGKPEAAIVGAANLGRDADTIGSFVGEIVGALSGWEAFPRDWAERVERLNPEPDMAKMAESLVVLIRRRTEQASRRSDQVLSMLS